MAKKISTAAELIAASWAGSENDFSNVALTGWDERVFKNADHFRLTRYSGDDHKTREDSQAADWPHALASYIINTRAGFRVIVYAVAASGRSCVCQPERFAELSDIYDASFSIAKEERKRPKLLNTGWIKGEKKQ